MNPFSRPDLFTTYMSKRTYTSTQRLKLNIRCDCWQSDTFDEYMVLYILLPFPPDDRLQMAKKDKHIMDSIPYPYLLDHSENTQTNPTVAGIQ